MNKIGKKRLNEIDNLVVFEIIQGLILSPNQIKKITWQNGGILSRFYLWIKNHVYKIWEEK